MYPKLVYQHQNRPSPASGEICTVPLEKVFLTKCAQLIYLLVLNLKTSITKVTGVSLGTPKDYMLKNFKLIPLSIRSQTPQLSYKWRITFHPCSNSKLLSPIILHFTKIKLLKSYEKCFLFHLNCSKWNNYDITKRMKHYETHKLIMKQIA